MAGIKDFVKGAIDGATLGNAGKVPSGLKKAAGAAGAKVGADLAPLLRELIGILRDREMSRPPLMGSGLGAGLPSLPGGAPGMNMKPKAALPPMQHMQPKMGPPAPMGGGNPQMGPPGPQMGPPGPQMGGGRSPQDLEKLKELMRRKQGGGAPAPAGPNLGGQTPKLI